VFSSVNHEPNDNRLLVLSLQLHLRVFKHDGPARQGLWDGALLQEPSCQSTFEQKMGNHFVILPSWVSNLKEEWGCFVTTVFTAAAKTVGMQGPVRWNWLGLSRSVLELVTAK